MSLLRYRESICRKGNGHFDEIATQTDFLKFINELINVIKLNWNPDALDKLESHCLFVANKHVVSVDLFCNQGWTWTVYPAPSLYGEKHPQNLPFLYVWFVVNSGETSKGSIGEWSIPQGWKRKGRGERDPEGGIGGERDPREWRCGLQKVLSG